MHDVMLYGFLISADPARCDLSNRWPSDIWIAKFRRDPAGQADAALAIFQKLRPEVEALGLVRAV